MNTSASLPGWIIATQWASRGVLVILLLLSVWSIAIMVDRYRALKGTETLEGLAEARQLITERNWSALKSWISRVTSSESHSPALRIPAGALLAALDTHSTSADTVDRAVRSYLSLERAKLESGLTTLATLGSNAPFIGLFGTVLGIIQAFGSLAAQNTSSNSTSVMTGISEALLATAVGLFVAIPAVVAYNVFSRKLKTVLVQSEALRDYYLSRLSPPEPSHGR